MTTTTMSSIMGSSSTPVPWLCGAAGCGGTRRPKTMMEAMTASPSHSRQISVMERRLEGAGKKRSRVAEWPP